MYIQIRYPISKSDIRTGQEGRPRMIYIRIRTIRISYIRFLQVFLTVMKLFVKINPMDIRNPDIKKHAKIQVGGSKFLHRVVWAWDIQNPAASSRVHAKRLWGKAWGIQKLKRIKPARGYTKTTN